MLNERLAVVRDITKGLTELEQLIDAAVVAHAKLQAIAIEGRRTANLPLDAGETGLDRLAEALPLMMAARKAVHASHYAFRDTRTQMRLPVVNYGDYGDTPDSVAPRGEHARLVLVDAKVA